MKVGRLLSLELLDDRYPVLHGVRVLAIVGVVQYHVTTVLTYETGLPLDMSYQTLSMSIFFGMDLFFVLSGFLIGSILLRSIETRVEGCVLRTTLAHAGRFWVRRAFRILPLYYVVLAVLALVLPLTASQKHHLPLEWLFLTNYAPVHRTDLVMAWGWSLAVEEHFYLAAPLLVYVIGRIRSERTILALLGILWIGALAVRLAVLAQHPRWSPGALYDHVYFQTHTRFDTLVAGIVLAFVHRRWREPIRLWLVEPWHRVLLGAPALACLWLLMQPWALGAQGFSLLRVLSWGTLTSVMYVLWLLLLLGRGGALAARALGAGVWRRFATLGYGVYLVHIPLCRYFVAPTARWLVRVRDWPMGVVWPASLLGLLTASLAMSYVAHLLVEKPAIWLRDRILP